jgi:3-hydroxyisobutyrate dehydrogenase-like beta-hydroxyacid dehydrogenase
VSLAAGIIGLGEAGSAIAVDLLGAGASVRGWDPATPAPEGVEAATGAADAARGAEIVLSANSPAAALEAAESARPELRPGQVFADLNTAAPGLKAELAAVVDPTGALFADVALIGPVPGNGIHTPALVSGAGSERFAELLEPFGMPVTVVGPEPGAAAARKLARSVFAKGLAAAIGEALAAAEALGFSEWLRADLERTLEGADAALLDRLIEGSRLHAERRIDEMEAAVRMLEDAGVEPRIASATETWLRALARGEMPETESAPR